MKKKKIILFVSCIVFMSGITVWVSVCKNKTMVKLILLTQIETMANNENGTEVATCYTDSSVAQGEFVIPCDRSTTSTRIYPCKDKEFSPKGPTSMCTK